MILLFKRRREREKALAAENAAKASQSQVPLRHSNFEKFNQRTRSLSSSPLTNQPSPKSKQSAGTSKASGSTENLRTPLKIPKSSGTERRKSSGNIDENSSKNEENSSNPTDLMDASKPVDDHLWSSNDQFSRNLP
ncbi:uncharacterized protein [Chironomus tepperi]|uniref:uncharacterized protein isoform X2 n=1 Tax=Chironomus tepperi TaxID=113505 RepID=UPI00391F7719